MELRTPEGSTEEATEPRVVEIINTLDPNSPATLQVSISDDDWVLVEMTKKGLRMENKDANSGLVLETKGAYLSKAQAITVLKQYIQREPKWNMHADWAPKAGGAAGKKKGGCMGSIIFFLGTVALLSGTVYYTLS